MKHLGCRYDRTVLFEGGGGGGGGGRDATRGQRQQHVLALAGTDVRVMHAKNGRRSHTLSCGERQSDVRALAVSRSNRAQILASSANDRSVSVWDMHDGSLLNTFKLGVPLHDIVTTFADPQRAYAIATDAKDTKWELVRFDVDEFTTRKRTKKKYERLIQGKVRKRKKSKTSKLPLLAARGRYVCVADGKRLEVFDVIRGKIAASYAHKSTITAVDICPSRKNMVAIGDVGGKIHLWYGLPRSADDYDRTEAAETIETAATTTTTTTTTTTDASANLSTAATSTVLHWHAHAVLSLAFDAEGTQLLSGGHEAVLVIWQIESQDRNFLPRLGGPILAIRSERTAGGTRAVLCCGDNSVRMVDVVTMNTCWRRSGLASYASSWTYRRRLGVAKPSADPLTKAVAVPTCVGGASASLQFWDPRRDKNLGDLDVGGRNRITRKELTRGGGVRSDDDKSKKPRSVVEAFDFSKDGRWLLTADATTIGDVSLRRRTLRFWKRGSKETAHTNLKFSVARIVVPEASSEAVVRCVAFDPSSTLVVTTHAARSIKRKKLRGISSTVSTCSERSSCCRVWSLRANRDEPSSRKANENNDDAPFSWSCRSVLRYRNVRPDQARWSMDSSLLCVAFGRTATLWGSEGFGVLLRVLRHPSPSPIHGLGLLDGSESQSSTPMLVVASKDRLTAYDLLTFKARFETCVDGKDARFGDLCFDEETHDRFAAVVVEAAEKGRRRRREGGTECVVKEYVKSSAGGLIESQRLERATDSIDARLTYAHVSGNGASGKQSVCCLEPAGSIKVITFDSDGDRADDPIDDDNVVVEDDANAMRIFSAGKKSGSSETNTAATTNLSKNHVDDLRDLERALSGPSHMLPPPKTLFKVLCDAMLPPPPPPLLPNRSEDDADEARVHVSATNGDDSLFGYHASDDGTSTDFDLDSIANESSFDSASTSSDSRRGSFEEDDEDEVEEDDEEEDYLFSTSLGSPSISHGDGSSMEFLIQEQAIAAAVESDTNNGMSVEDLRHVIFETAPAPVKKTKKKTTTTAATPKKRKRIAKAPHTAPPASRRSTRARASVTVPATERKRPRRKTKTRNVSAANSGGIARRTRSRSQSVEKS